MIHMRTSSSLSTSCWLNRTADIMFKQTISNVYVSPSEGEHKYKGTISCMFSILNIFYTVLRVASSWLRVWKKPEALKKHGEL